MKLLIILSVVASSYADKLDRTYLPPANAATAGGAPGSLTAPGTEPARSSGPSFSQTAEQFTRPSGPQSGRSYDASKSGIDSTSPQYQTGVPGPQFGQSGGSGLGDESNAFGQGLAYSGNQGSQEASAYSGQYQPERSNSADGNAEILRYDSQNDGDNFAYSFETSNGITAEESGVATNGVQAQGGYSYTGDDGQQYRVTYTADENGYQPQGDHLPTPHPIPEEILRSIEENARAAASGNQEGAYRPEEDSDLAPQQYNDASSYNGQYQTSGQSPSSYNQPGQSPASQFSGISTSPSSTSSGSQGYQYSAGSSRGLAHNEPTGSGFIPKGQALLDQGPSPSTPTASSIGFPTSSNSGNIQSQRGFNSPDFSASGRQGQGQSQPGYEYNRPQTSSQYGSTNQPEQYRPRPESQQSSNQFGSQAQGPAYTKPQGIGSQSGPTSVSGPNNQGFPKQGYGSTQGPSAPGYSPSVGPAPGSNSGPASSVQDFSYSRPNSPQGYSPTGPSSSPSASQSSAFPRTSSSNEGYVYGPGTGPSGTIAGNSLGSPSGQGFGLSGPSGNKNTVPQGSFPGQVGQTPASNFGAGLAPQGSGLTGYSKPNVPSASPRGFANGNGPFGDSSQYQATQPSAQLPQGSAYPRPSSSAQPSQGSGFDRPSGSDANSDKGSFGASPQYQPGQTSPSQNSAFPSLNGPNASKSPNNQGLFGSGINQPSGQKSSMLQSAPYQYNRPGFQDSQNQPGSQGPQSQDQSGSQPGFRTPIGRSETFGAQNQPGSQGPQSQDQSGSQPGFRTPTGRSETFGGPRQRPSFSQAEGYKY